MQENRQTRKYWLQLFRTNVVFWIAAGICSPFLSAYYKSIQLSSSQIGILFAISPVCAICIQPLWAYISDRSGKRKTVLVALAICTALSTLLYYCGKTFAFCLVAAVTMSLFSSALLPLCDAIVIDRAEAYHCNFATIRIGGTLGYALIVFLTGFFLERFPSMQFALACGAYLIFALVAWRIPMGDEQKTPVVKKPKEEPQKISNEKGIFVSNEVVFVLLFAFVESIGLGFCGSFTGVYAVELGHSQKLIGILSCISALSEVPILLCAQRIIRRFGEIPVLAFSVVMISVRLFLIGQGVVPAMICGQLLQGVTYMTTYYCCTRYISTHVRAGKMSQGQSMLTLVQSGLASVSSNLGGGWLVDRVGNRTAFMSMTAVVLIVAVLVIAVYLVYNRKNKVSTAKS